MIHATKIRFKGLSFLFDNSSRTQMTKAKPPPMKNAGLIVHSVFKKIINDSLVFWFALVMTILAELLCSADTHLPAHSEIVPSPSFLPLSRAKLSRFETFPQAPLILSLPIRCIV